MKPFWFCLLLLADFVFIVFTEEGACLIPTELPDALEFFNDTELHNEIYKGSYVPSLSEVTYKCKENYTLNGPTKNVCKNGNWNVSTHSKCIKFCPSLSGISINATCSLDDEIVSCLQPNKPGTIANITCAFGYQQEEPANETVNNLLHCEEDGEWDSPIFQCQQICGLLEPDFRTYVAKDRVEYVITVPWHVIIYSNAENDDYYKAVCDGTIVNAKTVISMAHCFWDKTERRFYDPSHLNMVPGKEYQYSYQSVPIQSQNVAQINYYTDFRGQGEYYALDLVALVIEEHFVFEVSLAPICIDTTLGDDDINSELSGEIIGWIITVSEGLRYHSLKLTNASVLNECVTKFSNELSKRNIGRDKFCVTYNRFGSFQPSRAGGFVVSKKVENKTVYSLRGIFSNFRPDRNRSKVNVLLTNLQYHLKMIEFHLNKTYDDIISCPDVSNEDPRLCGHFINTTRTIEKPTVEGSCLVPDDLSDSIKVYFDAKQNVEIAKGSYAVPFSQIIYRCEHNHTLIGSSDNFCLNGIWSVPNHPECLKFCSPKPLHGITIRATCEFNGEQIDCVQSHKPGTVAHIACALGYRKPIDRVSTDVLFCGENGEWDFPAFRCEQVCGIEAPDIVPYVVGGDYVNITKVPWHIGIFSDIKKRNYFHQICGGTILNAKVVISAAHCFWDSTENRFFSPSDFKVAAGKYYRDLYKMEPLQIQIVDVEKIYNKQEYNDYAGYYALDIVLLVLKDHIQFNSYIKPICIEYDLNFNEQQVKPGLIGRVAGWGLEASDARIGSEKLKVIDLPAIEYNECKTVLSAELLPFITGDKFCAGYTTGQSVCRGDSGGGLVFPKVIGSDTVYFLRGIVSTGGNKAGSCDNDKYTLFTNIQFHIKMILYYESHNRP